MARATASDRMRRVLAVVPWIVANPGCTVAEVASRFGLSEKELLDDLSVVYMVGLPPYSPDALVDVQIDDDGRVTIRLADFFSRPLRLTPGQGLALLASSDGLLSIPGTDPDGALARALAKLGTALGIDGEDGSDPIEVHLGSAEGRLLDQLRHAASTATEVQIDYFSYNRDQHTTRAVATWWVFADGGHWYLHAWCHRAEGERIFRVDRIESLVELGREAAVRPDDGAEGQGIFHPRDDHPRVVLELQPDAGWVVGSYPCEEVVDGDDGVIIATLVITAVPWLERLLVRLGPQARVLETRGLPGSESLAGDAASRILGRYRPQPSPS
ncbi:MAG: WYL domain-containing protein [Actinomycetota bacterium]